MRNAIVLIALVAAVATACGKADDGQSAAGAAAVPAGEEAVLLVADRADGAEDHVVSKCAVCNLSMDGLPEHASTYAGYTFHLCSAHCQETFDHDPAKVLARIKPPAS